MTLKTSVSSSGLCERYFSASVSLSNSSSHITPGNSETFTMGTIDVSGVLSNIITVTNITIPDTFSYNYSINGVPYGGTGSISSYLSNIYVTINGTTITVTGTLTHLTGTNYGYIAYSSMDFTIGVGGDAV